MSELITLTRHLGGVSPELSQVICAVADVAAQLSFEISSGPLRGELATKVGVNSDGDGQTKLDVLADRAFAEALRTTPTRWYASEERDHVEELNPSGRYAVAMDPLDGSSNIDTNLSIGTIFAIHDALPDGEASVVRPGRDLVAAGYVIYGPQTAMMVTTSDAVAHLVLDRQSRQFLLANARVEIPSKASEFAINASNYRHWSRPIRAYIDDCLAGETGPRGKNFNMRWLASLVAETHRIMARGGIFLYPADAREGYQDGRLRLIYECAPIALLVERAGGAASDACDRILDRSPAGVHARSPFVFGSKEKVARIAAYHELPEAEIAPLFGRRGLFTA